MKRLFLISCVVQFFMLLGFWLLLSGHYDFFHISMGVLSALLIVLLNLRLRKYYYFKEEISETDAKIKGLYPSRLKLMRFLFFYVPWLIWQIVIASLQVAYAVLRPKMPIDPSLVVFKTKLPNMGSKVILGNSITLTPGTITIQLTEDHFIVHALMDVSSTGIIDGTLPDQVAKLYEKKPGQVVTDVKIIKSETNI